MKLNYYHEVHEGHEEESLITKTRKLDKDKRMLSLFLFEPLSLSPFVLLRVLRGKLSSS